MAGGVIYCEECLEEIANDEVYWDKERLYCKQCGSEVEPPEGDIFDQIVENRTSFHFKDADPDDMDADPEEESKGDGFSEEQEDGVPEVEEGAN